MPTVSKSHFVPKSKRNALQFRVLRGLSPCLCLGAEVVFRFAQVGESLSAFPRLGGTLWVTEKHITFTAKAVALCVLKCFRFHSTLLAGEDSCSIHGKRKVFKD